MNSKTLIHALLITAAFAAVGFYGYREIKSFLVLQKMEADEKALAGPVAPSAADLQPEPEVRPKALPRRRERVKREVVHGGGGGASSRASDGFYAFQGEV